MDAVEVEPKVTRVVTREHTPFWRLEGCEAYRYWQGFVMGWAVVNVFWLLVRALGY